MDLTKIQLSIEEDMVRQRSRGLRAVQTVMWTLAPNGCNLGGKSMPGPVGYLLSCAIVVIVRSLIN